jgi:hypothetical protein
MSGDLSADLERFDAAYTRQVGEASALGTKPAARDAWEIAHQTAGIVATIRSRIREQVTRHLIADDPNPELSHLDRMDGL